VADQGEKWMPVQDSPTAFVTLNQKEAVLVKALAARASAESIAKSLDMAPAEVICQLAALRERLERLRLA
jgi:hypothetical protein